MQTQEMAEQLSELGRLIWEVIQDDPKITELFFELAIEKLCIDKVKVEDTQLNEDAAEAIMNFDLDPGTREHLRSRVPASEWLKYSIFNFALDWVLDQALIRMKMEQKWPFQDDDGFSKPLYPRDPVRSQT
jgi:hypothetical protein